jgi:hypothetical protein
MTKRRVPTEEQRRMAESFRKLFDPVLGERVPDRFAELLRDLK